MSKEKQRINNLDLTPLFGNVKCGDFFIYQKELCVRTGENTPAAVWEAFGFSRKKKFHIPHTDRVVLADCEIFYSGAHFTIKEYKEDRE